MAASVELFPDFPMVVHESHEHDRVRHRDAQAHDRAHERLDVQRCPRHVEDGRDPGEHARHGTDRDQGQARRLEIGGQEQEDHEQGDPEPDLQGLEHLVRRRELAHRDHPDPSGRRARGIDRPSDLAEGAAHVLPFDVRRDAQESLRSRSVQFAGHRALADLGHVADHQVHQAIDLGDRQGLDLGRRRHVVGRHQHLDLVVEASLRIRPVIERDEPAR